MSKVIPFDQSARLPEQYRRRASEIAVRVRTIDSMMAPASVEAVISAVVRMAGQFRAQPDEDQSEMAKEFKAACSDLPEWAISEATNDFLGGRVPNHTGQFMPTCAEFARRAREVIMPFLAERSSLRIEAEKLVERAADEARRNVIAIERSDPAVKARAQALIDQFTKGAPKRLSSPQHGIEPENQQRLDALKKQRPFVSKIGHRPGAGE